MDNIEYIEIITFNMFKRVKIDISVKDLKVISDDKIRPISIDEIKRLQEIIKYWEEDYQGFVLDAEKFTIRLISNNQIIKQHQGNGRYPSNYNEFKRWISDIV